MSLIMPDTAETTLNSSVGTETAAGMERVRRPGAVAAAMPVPRPHRGTGTAPAAPHPAPCALPQRLIKQGKSQPV